MDAIQRRATDRMDELIPCWSGQGYKSTIASANTNQFSITNTIAADTNTDTIAAAANNNPAHATAAKITIPLQIPKPTIPL